MIPRIQELKAMPNFMLSVLFDDGKRVLYDVKPDFTLPNYDLLRTIPRLFESVQLDKSRTYVFWNDEIDIPSDCIYEYGEHVTM